MGDLCIKLFHKNSIGTVIKHIPGHGCSSIDSHRGMPIVNLSENILNQKDFYPFNGINFNEFFFVFSINKN